MSRVEFDGKRQFATTQWSTVRALHDEDHAAANSALAELCQDYWYPLYAYVRRQGNDADAAADLTQAFFASLLQRDDLRKVDPSLGKFRSFLLAAMKHFLMNEWDKAKTQKRGGGRQPLSLDFAEADSRFRREPSHGETPELVYQRQWVQALLQRVTDALRSEFADRGKAHHFDRLQKFLSGKNREETLAEAAQQLSMTEVAVKVAVHRMRQRFGELLRADIAGTVSTPEDVDSEIRELFGVFTD